MGIELAFAGYVTWVTNYTALYNEITHPWHTISYVKWAKEAAVLQPYVRASI